MFFFALFTYFVVIYLQNTGSTTRFLDFFVCLFVRASNPYLDRKVPHILKAGRSAEAEVPVGCGPLMDALPRAVCVGGVLLWQEVL